ncbi:MAG: hypothetical protein K8R59_08260 [Thermoanaerobaculales bacterium]|nr:hypothetical protein [Thermoanaerobaculales bacterium]
MKTTYHVTAGLLFLLVCVSVPVSSQVVPAGMDAVAGSSNSGVFMGNFRPTRLQQVYSGAEIDSGVIGSLSFRLDEEMGTTAATCTWENATVILSSTSVAPDALSFTFADNHGADATTVYSGNLVLTNTDTTSDPRPFELTIPFSTPFSFDSTTGLNLLLDITAPIQDGVAPCRNYPILDIQHSLSDSVSVVFCWNGSCSVSFDTAAQSSTGGMVTLFVAEPIFTDGFENGTTSAWSVAVPDGQLGDFCSTGVQCNSGHCVDSVCCNEACGGGASPLTAMRAASLPVHLPMASAGTWTERRATTASSAPGPRPVR